MNSVVLITGASSGIGLAVAREFSESGWQVVATCSNPAAKPELRALACVRVLSLDVTDPESIAPTVSLVISEYHRIEMLVNYAGYGVDGIFEGMTDDVIVRQCETTLFGLRAYPKTFDAEKEARQRQIGERPWSWAAS